MPADPAELKEAMDEGVTLMYLTAPVSVEIENGKAVGLKCVKNQLSDPDESGRRKPVAIPGSEFVISADLIIEAIGSGSDESAKDVLEYDKKGYIIADSETCETSMPGVFAGGDAVTGPKTVISAMGEEKKAAKAIIAKLSRT